MYAHAGKHHYHHDPACFNRVPVNSVAYNYCDVSTPNRNTNFLTLLCGKCTNNHANVQAPSPPTANVSNVVNCCPYHRYQQACVNHQQQQQQHHYHHQHANLAAIAYPLNQLSLPNHNQTPTYFTQTSHNEVTHTWPGQIQCGEYQVTRHKYRSRNRDPHRYTSQHRQQERSATEEPSSPPRRYRLSRQADAELEHERKRHVNRNYKNIPVIDHNDTEEDDPEISTRSEKTNRRQRQSRKKHTPKKKPLSKRDNSQSQSVSIYHSLTSNDVFIKSSEYGKRDISTSTSNSPFVGTSSISSSTMLPRSRALIAALPAPPPPAPPIHSDLFRTPSDNDTLALGRRVGVRCATVPREAQEASKSFDVVLSELKNKLNEMKTRRQGITDNDCLLKVEYALIEHKLKKCDVANDNEQLDDVEKSFCVASVPTNSANKSSNMASKSSLFSGSNSISSINPAQEKEFESTKNILEIGQRNTINHDGTVTNNTSVHKLDDCTGVSSIDWFATNSTSRSSTSENPLPNSNSSAPSNASSSSSSSTSSSSHTSFKVTTSKIDQCDTAPTKSRIVQVEKTSSYKLEIMSDGSEDESDDYTKYTRAKCSPMPPAEQFCTDDNPDRYTVESQPVGHIEQNQRDVLKPQTATSTSKPSLNQLEELLSRIEIDLKRQPLQKQPCEPSPPYSSRIDESMQHFQQTAYIQPVTHFNLSSNSQNYRPAPSEPLPSQDNPQGATQLSNVSNHNRHVLYKPQPVYKPTIHPSSQTPNKQAIDMNVYSQTVLRSLPKPLSLLQSEQIEIQERTCPRKVVQQLNTVPNETDSQKVNESFQRLFNTNKIVDKVERPLGRINSKSATNMFDKLIINENKSSPTPMLDTNRIASFSTKNLFRSETCSQFNLTREAIKERGTTNPRFNMTYEDLLKSVLLHKEPRVF